MAGVKEIQRLAEANSKKTLRIYNPDTDDFTYNYHKKPYTVHALDITELPVDIANHLKKHLADHLLYKRGIKVNPQADLEAIFKEIEVELD